MIKSIPGQTVELSDKALIIALFITGILATAWEFLGW